MKKPVFAMLLGGVLGVFDGLSAPEPVSAPKPKRSGNLRNACRRAKKRGLPLPRLPAGSRWKRRLPWMCW